MNLKVTSSVPADKVILKALNPQEETPFVELLIRAQKSLDFLKDSRFFLRLIEENSVYFQHAKILRIARSSNDLYSEWLVITDNFRIRFMRLERKNDDLFFYDYGGHFHNDFLLAKSRSRLEKMATPTGFIEFLTSRHGTPSFTAEEVQAELTRNGKLTIFDVHSTATTSIVIDSEIAKLQFDPEIIVLDYSDPLPNIDGGEFIIVLDLEPRRVRDCMGFFNRLTAEQRQRLWTNRTTTDVMNGYYLQYGFSSDLLAYPSEFESLPITELLSILNRMFSDPE